MESVTARIVSRTGHPVQRIVLRMPDDFVFEAGQYLEVLHPDGPVPLSIASAPRRLPALHLHYQSVEGLAEAARMDALLGSRDSLEVRGPSGTVRLTAPLPAPALIAAGGTGMAQAMSFLDSFAGTESAPGAALTLLWCVDDEADFYLRDDLMALDAPWLDHVLIADPERSERNRAMTWLRQHGRAFAEKKQHMLDASPVVLCGGPGFVYAACDALRAVGVTAAQMQSDVFSYAPRPQ